MKNLATALVQAQKQFEPARKSSKNPHFRSTYANLATCVEAVIEALNDNGIFLTQTTHNHDHGVMVNTVFLHESGEMMDCGSLFVPAAKQDPQGFGSALTYARRYSLLAACGIAPEDDDGNHATEAHTLLTRIGKTTSLPQLRAMKNECGEFANKYPDSAETIRNAYKSRQAHFESNTGASA